MRRSLFLLGSFLFITACGDGKGKAPAPELRVANLGGPLTGDALAAIELAPKWLQPDLALALKRLELQRQNELAATLLEVEDKKWIDEIAFCIAHLSPEVLADELFYPSLLVENAELIYARDEDLKYVEIIDEGEPGVDEDYYTTAKYRVQLEDESIVERTIDKEIWYWYVVHPRIEDEFPHYVDPWRTCGGLECAHTPDVGTFWRDFLWEGAKDNCPDGTECPVIKDFVTEEVDVLWKSKGHNSDDNGAIGALIQFIKTEMNFGAHGERSIQPNRIYGLGRGNCGEWADMTSAIARTALVPSHNVGAWGNDHTWNEFWDDGWKQWEPVNNYVLHYNYYLTGEGESGGTPVYGVSATRGDALTWNRTEDYGVTFDLNLSVKDSDGNPVDGAVVALYGPITVYDREGFWFITEVATDSKGEARILLGEKNQYLIRVESGLGTFPVEENRIEVIIDESEAAKSEQVDVVIEGTMPMLRQTALPLPTKDTAIGVSVDYSIDSTRVFSPSQRLRGQSSQVADAVIPNGFIVDEANYDLFKTDQPYAAIPLPEEVSAPMDLELPYGKWTVVLPNYSRLSTALLGNLKVEVSPKKGDVVELGQRFEILPGDHVAIEINAPESASN